MTCSALLDMLIVFSVIGFCVTNEVWAVRQSVDLHEPTKKSHTMRHRLKRGWIWTQFFIQEEQPAPQNIGQLKSDSDKGDLSIKYVLSGEGAGDVFHIDEFTGKIITLRKLDREEKAFYVLRGQALNRRTNQPVEMGSEFIIHVQDINDNMPQFINEPYVSSIPEMCPVGTTVAQVTATDADDPLYGNNAKLIYSIQQGEPYFSVEPKTGIIVTSWPNMDRETQEKYLVIVQVKDMMGLSGGHSATTTVTISLSDVNDNGPTFQHNLFTFAVAESAPVGTTVGRIMADDPDVGINARMNYSFEEADGSDTFQIRTDPVTQEGVILLVKPLDYESKKRFVMAAEAFNDNVDTRFLSYNEFRDRTTLKIFVEDVDEPPVFTTGEYEWKIQENMAAGTTVGVVSARDSDAANNPVRYYIAKGSDMKREFKIDPDNGTIMIAKSLDREDSAWHNLTVTAKEKKQNFLFSSALVFIKVLDVNDNAPQLSQEYRPYICEGVQSGELVQVISAVDQDDPPEGHHFYFSMVPEKRINPNFTLRDNQDNTASILTRRSSFNRQDRTQYLLPVVITDSGSPALTSTATLTISVCSCQPAGHCPTGGVEAFAISMGLSVPTLIGILVSLLTLTVLSILMLAVWKHRKQRQKKELAREKGTERWDYISEKVLRYSETGVGEADSVACRTVPLRPHPRRRERRLRREEVTASIRMSLRHSYLIGPEDEVFQQFILDRLADADNDPCVPPFDCLHSYAFEGTGSPAGSLSSLGSCASEPNFERPPDPGPRFMRLAPWTGAGEEQTTF
ncbi:cadherin-7 [Anguilla rostrata]|uniref:cadherin-7 n=1 Tax=Anguilla anguilla TaxID=7936 RepID=UPI0015B1766B|nr:cadherin-7 [Anguilla anguilla]